MDMLKMKMTNVGVAFKVLEDDQSTTVGYAKSSDHFVWNVSRNSIRIAFTYAFLNDLDVWAAEIKYIFILAP